MAVRTQELSSALREAASTEAPRSGMQQPALVGEIELGPFERLTDREQRFARRWCERLLGSAMRLQRGDSMRPADVQIFGLNSELSCKDVLDAGPFGSLVPKP